MAPGNRGFSVPQHERMVAWRKKDLPMQNRTTIINTALMRVGANGVNIAFQDTPAAQTAEAAYQRTLDLCLSLYPWPFAMRLVRLAQNAETPAFGYRHAYRLPGDCVRVVDVRFHDDEGEVPSFAYRHEGPRYEIVGQDIMTDAPAVALRYVSNNKSMTFPETFADAVAWRLCVEIAQYVEQSGNAQTWFELFEQSLDRAKVEADAQQQPITETWPSRVLAERLVY